jgi:hypothetical protein
MKTFITALALVIALACSISMMALAFRTDFRESAADNGGDRTMSESPRSNSESTQIAAARPSVGHSPRADY